LLPNTAKTQSLVIDASVLMAAVSPSEIRHADAKALLVAAHAKSVVLQEPVQFMLEIWASFRRRPRDLQQLGFMTLTSPVHMNLWPMAEADVQGFMTWLSANFPAIIPTRGGDLAYVWTALKCNVPLVSLDVGLQGYSGSDVTVADPKAALQFLP